MITNYTYTFDWKDTRTDQPDGWIWRANYHDICLYLQAVATHQSVLRM